MAQSGTFLTDLDHTYGKFDESPLKGPSKQSASRQEEYRVRVQQQVVDMIAFDSNKVISVVYD